MFHPTNHISITFAKPQGNLAQKQINGTLDTVSQAVHYGRIKGHQRKTEIGKESLSQKTKIFLYENIHQYLGNT